MAGGIVVNTINTDTGLFSTNNAYLGIAKAWVNFTGSSGAINGTSLNVSSVTRTGTGRYTINLVNALSNYCVNITSDFSITSVPVTGVNGSLSTTSFGVATNNGAGTAIDNTYVFVSVFSS